LGAVRQAQCGRSDEGTVYGRFELGNLQEGLKRTAGSGQSLIWAMQKETHPEDFKKAYKPEFREKYDEIVKLLPRFASSYQGWYSEAQAVIKQLIPDRLHDFVRHYEIPKGRKDISWTNYTIEDYLQGLRVTRGYNKEVVVDSRAAIPRFEQQIAILRAAEKRFESSLFDIRQLVQADILDSEIDVARVLQKNGFLRAAGAVVGVVIEKHLAQVCINHNVRITKKNPAISDFNDALKAADAIDAARWRNIQYLGDLRNICCHNRGKEPTEPQTDDLIDGAEKLIKTLF
jgi:hypothetical protein